MAWNVNFGDDKVVSLDDLNPEAYDKIAADDPEATWWGIYTWPGGNSKRLYAVICAAADHVNVEHPPLPTSMVEARSLLDMLEQAEDIEEKPMIDGFPPMPDAPAPGFTSGAPGDSDGPQTSSTDNASETS